MENPITGAVNAQQLRTPDKPRRLLSAAVITCGEQITHCGHKPLVLGKSNARLTLETFCLGLL